MRRRQVTLRDTVFNGYYGVLHGHTALVLAGCSLAFCLLAQPLESQTAADAELVSVISAIKAIDNHAHPMRLVAENETDPDWDDFPMDAYAVSGVDSFPVRLRPDNPELGDAWHALWGVAPGAMTEAHARMALAAKRRAMREHGDGYPAWILDQLGIETMLANRVVLGRGLAPPRFRWVAFADALLMPLDTAALQKDKPAYRPFYTGLQQHFREVLAERKQTRTPATLDEYIAQVVRPTLEADKTRGAVALKFEAAYFRPLDFAPVAHEEAAEIYARYAAGGSPAPVEYKKLQDFIFFEIAREAGRLKLPVHLHSSMGAGEQFEVGGINPVLLEPVLHDPSLQNTTFVLLHGGWPYVHQVTALLGRHNLYADFSAQTFMLPPRALAAVIREWLEFFPERVLFGTDAFPSTPELNWEEYGWMTTNTARKALALALTGMMTDGEISRSRAVELAHMVMHDNAARLYGWQRP